MRKAPETASAEEILELAKKKAEEYNRLKESGEDVSIFDYTISITEERMREIDEKYSEDLGIIDYILCSLLEDFLRAEDQEEQG